MDFIVVVKEKLSQDIKLQIMKVTSKLNEIASFKGIEMSIILQEY